MIKSRAAFLAVPCGFATVARMSPLVRIAAGLCLSCTAAIAGTAAKPDEDKTARDIFSYDTSYTGGGSLKNNATGRGDSHYTDFTYDHRFPVSGKWYFRTGFEYERFDFGGSQAGLPNHLQAAFAHLALEYIVQDHAGAGISIEPGFYFQNRVGIESFDVPWRLWISFPLKKDRLFGVLGVGGALYQDPVVAPGGGIIWLISEKVRLEGVIPKPALVVDLSDDWELRIHGELLFESFRTDDVIRPSRALNLHNAVVEYSEYRAGVQLTCNRWKPFAITLGGGYSFEREFHFFRANQRQTIGGARYAKVGVEAKF